MFEFIHDGMQKGAIGVNLGRNIWQNDFPVAMIRAIRAVVHERATAAEAHELYQDLKSSEGRQAGPKTRKAARESLKKL